ncbi:MAG: leucyl aminopeptidase [Pseudomonadota bacterium]
MTNIRFSARVDNQSIPDRSACVVLPLSPNQALGRREKALDKAVGGAIGAALKRGDFSGEAGTALMLHSGGELQRVLLLGMGQKKPSRSELAKMSTAIAAQVQQSSAADATLLANGIALDKKDREWFFSTLAKDQTYRAYRYSKTLSNPKAACKLKRFNVSLSSGNELKAIKTALSRGCETGRGINFARELANLPANICTPDYLAKQAKALAQRSPKATCKVLNEKAMSDLGMHSLLSVTAGTVTPARLIVLDYRGGKKGDAPHALVGKGITFDSGGISLKPGAKMDEMKFDMGGAASVLGAMHAVVSMKLPLNVVMVIAAAENMPSGKATKPGDVVTAMNGTTIEVLNTDAEGRLVLCDALTYVERFKPASVVDTATLTGACIVALGSHASGLYANSDALADALLTAGEESNDRAWRMPLWDDYKRQLNSNFADLANIGGPGAGSVTAACFLAHFAGAYPWAHLDIAGSAWHSSPKGATGRPVGLLTQYLISCSDDS